MFVYFFEDVSSNIFEFERSLVAVLEQQLQ